MQESRREEDRCLLYTLSCHIAVLLTVTYKSVIFDFSAYDLVIVVDTERFSSFPVHDILQNNIPIENNESSSSFFYFYPFHV